VITDNLIKIVVKEIPFLKQHGGSAKSVVISRFDDDDY
jgi:hypothetical protein